MKSISSQVLNDIKKSYAIVDLLQKKKFTNREEKYFIEKLESETWNILNNNYSTEECINLYSIFVERNA